jgi:hypothetical protein
VLQEVATFHGRRGGGGALSRRARCSGGRSLEGLRRGEV